MILMSEPWYRDGLRFECTRCGNCCTGEPGYVWFEPDEMAEIAKFRGEEVVQAERLYSWRAGKRRSLREKANGDCIFFERGQGCTIYPVRPRQCRTWPFWESNVETPADWQTTAKKCPGIGRGDLIPVEEITLRTRVVVL